MIPPKPVSNSGPFPDDAGDIVELGGPPPSAPETHQEVGLSPFPVEDEPLENEPLGQYAQDELAQIRESRQAFEAEKRIAESALEQRRQELDRQSQLLVSRLQELHEREQRLADELEDALPERVSEYPRRSRGKTEGAEAPADASESQILESEGLRRQLREVQMSLELLSAERDAAWSQLQQYREQQRQLEELRNERDALQAQLSASFPEAMAVPSDTSSEIDELRQQVQTLLQQQEEMSRERDEALGYLQELPERLQQLEKVKGERDAALEQLRTLTENFQKELANKPDSEWVDLDSPQGERTLMHIQLREQQEMIEQLRHDRDEAWACVQEMQQAQPVQEKEEVEQLRGERDAALEQLRKFSGEPEHWAQEEAEFSALRLQIKQEQRQLAEDAKELHRRETDMNKRLAQAQQEMQREQQRLEMLAQELANLGKQLREDRSQYEARESDLRLRDAQVHLREAEIREMIEIAELDNARERSELNQERLKLARLREALRLDRDAMKVEQEKLAKRKGSGSSSGSKF